MSDGLKHPENLPVLIRRDQYIKNPRFEKMFPRDGADLNDIVDKMAGGFDETQAIHLVCLPEEGKLFIGDGHRRDFAAEEHNIETVTAYIHNEFQTEQEAYDYFFAYQTDRRNITDYDIYYNIKHRDDFRSSQGVSTGEGKTREMLAKKFKTNRDKIQCVFKLIDEGNEEEIRLIKEVSINKAITELKKRLNGGKEESCASEPAGENESAEVCTLNKGENESAEVCTLPRSPKIPLVLNNPEEKTLVTLKIGESEYLFDIYTEQQPGIETSLIKYLNAVRVK